jgi:hypothetical protein
VNKLRDNGFKCMCNVIGAAQWVFQKTTDFFNNFYLLKIDVTDPANSGGNYGLGPI